MNKFILPQGIQKQYQPFKEQENAFDYFIIYGLKNEDINGNKTFSELKNLEPIILSNFPNISNNEINDLFCSEKINQMIFPSKSDYILKLNYTDLDVKINKKPYEDYIIETECENIIPAYYHCFSSKYQSEKSSYCYLWHIGVLVFYEQVQVSDSKPLSSYFAAKAIVLVSKKTYFILFKMILNEIYDNYLQYMEQPLELIIVNFYDKLRYTSALRVKISNEEYFIQSESDSIDCISLLPSYDLNLAAFFSIFSLNDFLTISEQFLKRWPIILISKDVTILYPTYMTIMTLIYPLDITNINDFYNLLQPFAFTTCITSSYASFLSIYSATPPDDCFKAIAYERGSKTLVINLDEGTLKMYMKNESLNKAEMTLIDQSRMSIIEFILTEHLKDLDLLNFINNDIELMKICSNSICNKNKNYFYYVNPVKDKHYYGLICKIRKQFFTLFSKILSFNIPYTEISILNINKQENKKKPANQIEINFQRSLPDPRLVEFFEDFKSTPSFNLVYKYKCKSNDSNLKNLILLDELIKILKIDDTILYFDECLSFLEKLPENSIEFSDKNLFYKIGDLYNGMHVYNLNLFRNKTASSASSINNLGYKLDDQGSDRYLIKYFNLKLYFECFDFFYKKTGLFDQIQMNKNNIEKDLNILLYEIKVFIHLIKTGSLWVENLDNIVSAIYIVLLSIEMFSFDNFDENKFLIIFNLFKRTRGLGNHFSFISSLIYEIINSDSHLYRKYELEFLEILKDFHLMPTFNIVIKANNDIKGDNFNNDRIHIDGKNKNITKVEPIIYDLFCINGCFSNSFLGDKKKILLEKITFSNMKSLKCKFCEIEDFIRLTQCHLYNGEILESEGPLKHPMQILLGILNEIILRESFIFDNDSLNFLYDSSKRKDTGVLYYLINQFMVFE